jgi:hypothetical protein
MMPIDEAAEADRAHPRRVRLRKQHVLRLAQLHDPMLCSTLYRGLEFNSETSH